MVRGQGIEQRLAEIDARLAELRRAHQRMSSLPGQNQDPAVGAAIENLQQAQQRAREADQHWQSAVAMARRGRLLAEQAFRSAARAHLHAAEAHERSARSRIGDVAGHQRLAEFHRAAAEADRHRAEQIQRGEVGRGDLPGGA